jgi:hypothetical protein
MLTEYTVWIVPPKNEGGLFKLCIHPRLSPHSSQESVAQTLATRQELKAILVRGLSEGRNSVVEVERMIEGTVKGTFNWKTKGRMFLSDEQARRLGWSHSTRANVKYML